MNRWILLLGLLIFSVSIFAHNRLTVIDKPFDITAFTQCKSYIDQCDLTGSVRHAHCVKKTVQRNTVCAQLQKISKRTDVTGDQITAEKMGNLTLLSLHYPADGQVLYQILSSDGYLYDLNIDSRDLDKKLAAQYRDQVFFMIMIEKPRYQKVRLGGQAVIVMQQITQHCLACATIGHATVRFNFDSQGRYLNVQLIRFSRR